MRLFHLLLVFSLLFPSCKAESNASSGSGAEENTTPTKEENTELEGKLEEYKAKGNLAKVAKLVDNDTIDCYANLQKFVAGQEITVPIMSSELNGLVSFQFTLQFDTAVLSFVGIEKNKVAENANVNFNPESAPTGMIPVLWISEDAEPANFDPKIFTLRFLPRKNGLINEAIAINSAAIITEGCYENPPCQPIRLLFSEPISKVKYAGAELALSVFPNPAADFVSIQCPKSSRPFQFHLRNASGKLIKEGRMPENGLLRIPRNGLPAGVYMVQLDAEGSMVATKQFVFQ
ncbi:MAG: cohesin domain-containing protein [Saprospiraceae bacterium]